MKKRIDQLLVERGFVDSRAKAQALILAGKVLVNDQPIDKPGKLADVKARIRLKDKGSPYVSRGGIKLKHALKEFAIDPAGKTCLDVGASTGGFTDCLLQHGAKKIYAVDVGYGQLAWELRKNPRVVVIERQNIRQLTGREIPELLDLVTIDVSFISLKLVFPPIKPFLKNGATIIALVKPQFEVGVDKVGKGGVVRDVKLHEEVLQKILKLGADEGWNFLGATPSPILGAKGNQEFLTLFQN